MTRGRAPTQDSLTRAAWTLTGRVQDPRSRSNRPTPRFGRLIGSRRWPRRVLIAVNILVALCIVGTASAYGYVQWRLDQIHREHISNLAGGVAGGQPFTMLIVGSDSRSALANNADNKQFGGSSATPGQRSDTIILARVAPATRQIMLLSIPRDLWVNIPGHGDDRINSAFDTGANLLVQTIQADLGIAVNHYVEVNFDTFRDVSNAVGGVSFYFPTPAKDAYSLLNVARAGCVALSGDQALAFVRSRHYEYYLNGSWHFEAESDLARIQRQQAFIKKMIKKAEGEFTNPLAINDIISGVTKNLTVDSGFSSSLLLSLAKEFRSIDASAIPTITLPNYAYTTAGGADVLGLQQPQAAQAIAAFNAFGNAPPPSPTTTHPSTPTTGHKTSTPSTTAAPPVSVAPSSVSIEVVNGTGVVGQAKTLASLLSGYGYNTKSLTTSPGYSHPMTEILYGPASLDAARQLATQIPGGATLTASSTLPAAYNLEVISGTSFSTAESGSSPAPSAAGSGSSASTAPTTTVPGTNASGYSLPGLPAGEAAPNC
ncbi:MAG: LCP family protein [Acidimicrobiales bacterium]|nr:LCP family protein [Acidimicrobiales bacterium]